MTHIAVERRAAAAHPGPVIKRDYLDVLGVDAAAFGRHAGIDPARMQAMLDGSASIDVDAAVRIARALQLPADRIMHMQLAFDFAAARRSKRLAALDVLPPPPQPPSFPDVFVRGKLARASDETRGDASYFFQQDLPREVTGDAYAGLHALWRGDRLRIYDGDRNVLWSGPVLQDLDGRVLLPYVEGARWQAWFAAAQPADLAIGAEHAAFFERMTSD